MLWLSMLITIGAERAPYPKYLDNWAIFENQGQSDCTAMTQYSGQKDLLIHFGAAKSEIVIQVMDPAFGSLEADKSYDLEMDFVYPVDGGFAWGKVPARGIRLAEDSPGFTVTLHDVRVLDELAKSDIIGFKRGDTMVASLKLTGGAQAIRELRTCAVEVQRAHPIDP